MSIDDLAVWGLAGLYAAIGLWLTGLYLHRRQGSVETDDKGETRPPQHPPVGRPGTSPSNIQERLSYAAASLMSYDKEREKRNDPTVCRDLERRIIDKELAELEWLALKEQL